MSKKKKKNLVDEFFETPVGSFMAAFENYVFLIKELLKNAHEDETLLEELDAAQTSEKIFIEKFENFSRIDDFYIDDVNLLISMLEEIDEENRNKILKTISTYINFVGKVDEDESFKNINEIDKLFQELQPAAKSYCEVAPVFFKVNLSENQYAVLLRQVFRFLVDFSQKFLENQVDIEKFQVGYDLKNYSLIFRRKIKNVKANADSIDFIFEFFESLSEDEKDYFSMMTIPIFIECCQKDLDAESPMFENEENFVFLARQVKWALDKKYHITEKTSDTKNTNEN